MALKWDNTDPRFYDARLFKGGKSGGSSKNSTQNLVAQQTQSNKDTAWYNAMLENMNQVTPYGNLTYTNNGDKNNPQWTSTINLSPEQQQLYDTQTKSDNALASLGNEQIGRIRDSVSTPYSYDNIGFNVQDGDIATQQARAEEAYFSRLNPQFQQDEESLRTRLINQGIGQGSQAYQREMDAFNQAKNDARSQAVLAGQQYGNSAANQQLALRNQGINEYNAQRNAPLNEYTAMTSGAQVQNPTFTSGGNSGIAPIDLISLYTGQNNANTAAKNNRGAAMSSIGGGIGTAIGGPAGGFIGSGVGSLFGK